MAVKHVNIGIVDDHSLFRKTLSGYFTDHTNLKVLVQASDIPELLDKLKDTPIDVLLLDIFLPGLSGHEAVGLLRGLYPELKVLVLSMCMDMDLISNLIDAGIHGYISKADEPEELVYAIQATVEGGIYRNKVLTEALYRNRQNIRHEKDDPAHALNEREKKILQFLWEEKTNKEIADELYLGVRSVEKIRQDMKEKLNIKSTIGLLKYAIRKRIIGIEIYSSGMSI